RHARGRRRQHRQARRDRSAGGAACERHRREFIVTALQSRPPLLLIADDEPVNLKLLVDGLRDDFRIRIATDGETALTIAGDEEETDLILLDVMMPRIYGIVGCRVLYVHDCERDL